MYFKNLFFVRQWIGTIDNHLFESTKLIQFPVSQSASRCSFSLSRSSKQLPPSAYRHLQWKPLGAMRSSLVNFSSCLYQISFQLNFVWGPRLRLLSQDWYRLLLTMLLKQITTKKKCHFDHFYLKRFPRRCRFQASTKKQIKPSYCPVLTRISSSLAASTGR